MFFKALVTVAKDDITEFIFLTDFTDLFIYLRCRAL